MVQTGVKTVKASHARFLVHFLDAYADELGNSGCNDYYLENTKENQKFMIEMHAWNVSKPITKFKKTKEYKELVKTFKGEKIPTQDFFVLAFLKHKLVKKFGV